MAGRHQDRFLTVFTHLFITFFFLFFLVEYIHFPFNFHSYFLSNFPGVPGASPSMHCEAR